jgi:hypothetical protein
MDTEDHKGFFALFARDAEKGGSPLYARLASEIADEPLVAEILARRRIGQPGPNLLLAAAHFLLLRGADHPLRDYFLSCGGARPADNASAPQFLDFCARHKDAMAALVATRATNTNEAGRSAALAPGIVEASRREVRPLFLVELGPSAGLNLNFDRYAYRYAGEGVAARDFWSPSPLMIACEARGANVPDLGVSPPPLAGRIGLEREPVDIQNTDERDWLRALVWPERLDRLARLDAAMEIARAAPPPIMAGDAIGNLKAACALAPADAAIIVAHTFVVYQFAREARLALDDALAGEAQLRPLWRLSLEAGAEGDYALALSRPGESEEILALCSPHGLWVDWRAPRPGA